MSQATRSIFRVTGALASLDVDARRTLSDRGMAPDDDVRATTAALIARVRAQGDAALRAMAREFDAVTLDALEVPRARCTAALDALDPALRRAMERTARNLRSAHAAFLPAGIEVETEPGVLVGRRPDPLHRVGVYAPGGRAAYPSSLLMGAVPARVAGVGEVIICSPPARDGLPSPVVLAAAALAGADRVFAVGGAGAIAAMAYGTTTIPRVDRIVGPGNAYVAEAKLQVSVVTSIDAPAGPSELLVVADERADAETVAREVIAQAEHDPRAAVVVVALGMRMASAITAAIAVALPGAARQAIVIESLATRGGLLVAASLGEALTFVDDWAPEHLLLAVADPAAALASVRNAGTVFLGETSSVAFGDYLTGANHVLPTGGLARSYSGLSTSDFLRWTTYQRVDRAAAGRLAADTAAFAHAEGLPGHAAAAAAWGAP
jgi:histidinol dehydrogenase